MNADTKRSWEDAWERINRLASETKDEVEATEALSMLYDELPARERRVVDQLLADWVLSPDQRKRYDALALARRHHIDAAVPAMQKLLAEVEEADTVEGPYLAAQLRRLLKSMRAGG